MWDIHQLLEIASTNPDFVIPARAAIEIMRSESATPVLCETGGAQSSTELARTYSVRRNIGYFDKKKVDGLDATIESLGARERSVCLLYAQIGTALISVWVETETPAVAGLLVIEGFE